MPKGQASRFATDQAKSKISVGRPRALIFSERGLAPGEKIASLQIPRPEIQRISAESEKGWCGGESVPSASGRAREGRSPLDFQSKGFSAGKSYPFPIGGGSGGEACSPGHISDSPCNVRNRRRKHAFRFSWTCACRRESRQRLRPIQRRRLQCPFSASHFLLIFVGVLAND